MHSSNGMCGAVCCGEKINAVYFALYITKCTRTSGGLSWFWGG